MNRYLKEASYQLRYGIPVWFVFLLFSWLPDIGPVLRARGGLISLFLPGRPKRLVLGRDVTLLSLNRLKVGDNIYIAKGTWINAMGGVELEDDVVLAPYVVMSSSNHGFKDGSVQAGGAHPAPIKICFGTWVSSHSVITAGVTVGRGNLVGANSVVTKNTEDDVVVVGVPAKVVKARVDNPSSIKNKHEIKLCR